MQMLRFVVVGVVIAGMGLWGCAERPGVKKDDKKDADKKSTDKKDADKKSDQKKG